VRTKGNYATKKEREKHPPLTGYERARSKSNNGGGKTASEKDGELFCSLKRFLSEQGAMMKKKLLARRTDNGSPHAP